MKFNPLHSKEEKKTHPLNFCIRVFHRSSHRASSNRLLGISCHRMSYTCTDDDHWIEGRHLKSQKSINRKYVISFIHSDVDDQTIHNFADKEQVRKIII